MIHECGSLITIRQIGVQFVINFGCFFLPLLLQITPSPVRIMMEGKWANYEGADTHIVIKPWIRGAWPMVNDPYIQVPTLYHKENAHGKQNLLNYKNCNASSGIVLGKFLLD